MNMISTRTLALMAIPLTLTAALSACGGGEPEAGRASATADTSPVAEASTSTSPAAAEPEAGHTADTSPVDDASTDASPAAVEPEQEHGDGEFVSAPASADAALVALRDAGLCTGEFFHQDETEETLTGESVPVTWLGCKDTEAVAVMRVESFAAQYQLIPSLQESQANDVGPNGETVTFLRGGSYFVAVQGTDPGLAKEVSAKLGLVYI